MPPLKPRPQEELAAEQAEFQEQVAQLEPWMANAESAEYDHEDGILPYRGRRYRVPPVPYRIGVRIYCLERLVDWCHRESKKLEKDGKNALNDPFARWVDTQLVELYPQLAALYWRCVRPLGSGSGSPGDGVGTLSTTTPPKKNSGRSGGFFNLPGRYPACQRGHRSGRLGLSPRSRRRAGRLSRSLPRPHFGAGSAVLLAPLCPRYCQHEPRARPRGTAPVQGGCHSALVT
jgi:hypothetical protein